MCSWTLNPEQRLTVYRPWRRPSCRLVCDWVESRRPWSHQWMSTRRHDHWSTRRRSGDALSDVESAPAFPSNSGRRWHVRAEHDTQPGLISAQTECNARRPTPACNIGEQYNTSSINFHIIIMPIFIRHTMLETEWNINDNIEVRRSNYKLRTKRSNSNTSVHNINYIKTRAVLSQGPPRDAPNIWVPR